MFQMFSSGLKGREIEKQRKENVMREIIQVLISYTITRASNGQADDKDRFALKKRASEISLN